MIDLAKIQSEMVTWQQHNFPGRGVHIPLLGTVEEVGELAQEGDDLTIVELSKSLGKLAHAHIKKEQKIRTTENHDKNKKDAIGDIFIYLIDYSNHYGYCLETVIQEVWEHVKCRDWVKFPKNGRTE